MWIQNTAELPSWFVDRSKWFFNYLMFLFGWSFFNARLNSIIDMGKSLNLNGNRGTIMIRARFVLYLSPANLIYFFNPLFRSLFLCETLLLTVSEILLLSSPLPFPLYIFLRRVNTHHYPVRKNIIRNLIINQEWFFPINSLSTKYETKHP